MKGGLFKMNFYKLTSNLKDGISVLNHSSNKINLKVPLSSYHDEAQKFLEHLKSSENSDANEPSGLVPSQDQEIDSEEVGEKLSNRRIYSFNQSTNDNESILSGNTI